MATSSKTTARVFTFLNEEILAGDGDVVLPGSAELSGVVKRYAVGGENRMHSHPTEDHAFYILQGQATFHLEDDGNVVVASRHDGIFLPAGASYWFESTGDEKLVILRSGTQTGSDRIIGDRLIPSQRTTANAQHVEAWDLPF